MMNRMKLAGFMALAAMMERPQYSPKKEVSSIDLARINGLNEFYYTQGTIWALNQKNADKKARKKGWI